MAVSTTEAVNFLDSEFKVPGKILGLPIGLKATDRYVDTLRKMAGVAVPEAVNFERGQVVDVISDYSQYFYGKKVAIAGDPDQVLALVGQYLYNWRRVGLFAAVIAVVLGSGLG